MLPRIKKGGGGFLIKKIIFVSIINLRCSYSLVHVATYWRLSQKKKEYMEFLLDKHSFRIRNYFVQQTSITDIQVW